MSTAGTSHDGGAAALLSAAAVRQRCRMVLEAGLARGLAHFTLDMAALWPTADYVAETIRLNYPTLEVPPHARWRHFVIDGIDRWPGLARHLSPDPHERARQRFELAVVSVLLDAGAGPDWQFAWSDAQGRNVARRSEGLAMASLYAFGHGLFAGVAGNRQVDGAALRGLGVPALTQAFEAGPHNPLAGLAGRVALLNRLGHVVAERTDIFGPGQRLGALFDTLIARAAGGSIAAPDILALLLDVLGPIWPGRITLDGVHLGDTWRHPAITVPGPTNGLIPFHKLSQWLAYSLIEPLQEAGLAVTDQDGLTGLAEYRNGGLFIDLAVIVPRSAALLSQPLSPSNEAVVEWRALTVALLDEIAPLVRAKLGLDAKALPLAAVLEGGTWKAGRRIAAQLRPGGAPPLTIISDGSVF